MIEFFAESPDIVQFARSNQLISGIVAMFPNIDKDNISVVPFTLAKLFPRLNIAQADIASFITNSRQFHLQMAIKGDELIGKEVPLPEKVGENEYNPDTGCPVDLNALRKNGIDPSKVLLFRISLPSDEEKPELFWQTDIEAVIYMHELSPERKSKSVVLVSTLEDVASVNGGIVLDPMDNNGLSFRQIGTKNFPRNRIIVAIPFVALF